MGTCRECRAFPGILSAEVGLVCPSLQHGPEATGLCEAAMWKPLKEMFFLSEEKCGVAAGDKELWGSCGHSGLTSGHFLVLCILLYRLNKSFLRKWDGV